MSLRTTIYVSNASEKRLAQAQRLSGHGASKVFADMLELGMTSYAKRYKGKKVKRAKVQKARRRRK